MSENEPIFSVLSGKRQACVSAGDCESPCCVDGFCYNVGEPTGGGVNYVWYKFSGQWQPVEEVFFNGPACEICTANGVELDSTYSYRPPPPNYTPTCPCTWGVPTGSSECPGGQCVDPFGNGDWQWIENVPCV